MNMLDNTNQSLPLSEIKQKVLDEISLIEKQITIINLDYISLIIGIASSIILVVGIGFQQKLWQLWIPSLFLVDFFWGAWGVLQLFFNIKNSPPATFFKQYNTTNPNLLDTKFAYLSHVLSNFGKANVITHLISLIAFFILFIDNTQVYSQDILIPLTIVFLILVYLYGQMKPKLYQDFHTKGLYSKSSKSYEQLSQNKLQLGFVGLVIALLFFSIIILSLVFPAIGVYFTFKLGIFTSSDVFYLIFVILSQISIISVLASYFSAIDTKMALNNWLSTNSALLMDLERFDKKQDSMSANAIYKLFLDEKKYLVKVENLLGFLLFFNLIEFSYKEKAQEQVKK